MAGQGGIDLLGLIPAKDYWDRQKVEISVDTMVAQLTATQPKGDIPALAEKLSSLDAGPAPPARRERRQQPEPDHAQAVRGRS